MNYTAGKAPEEDKAKISLAELPDGIIYVSGQTRFFYPIDFSSKDFKNQHRQAIRMLDTDTPLTSEEIKSWDNKRG